MIVYYSSFASEDKIVDINNYYVRGCNIPYIVIETITFTENERLYPYYIRTNSKKTLDNFSKVIKKYNYKQTKDPLLIDCINYENCVNITNDLIENGEHNLDLGLRQINYNQYPGAATDFFDIQKSYYKSCDVVNEKIGIAKTWDWSIAAAYHSFSPERNERYKEKLLNNYFYLINNKEFINNILPKDNIEKKEF